MNSLNDQLADSMVLQLGFEEGFSRRAQALLQDIADDCAKIYETAPDGTAVMAVSYALIPVNMRFEKLLRAEYPPIIQAFSGMNFHNLLPGKKMQRKAEEEQPQYRSDFSQLADQWIQQNVLSASETIALTTRQDILNIILQGQAQALSAAAIAKMIRDKAGEEISRYRAQTIAITETHNAATFANFESARLMDEDLELGLKKVWLAAEDARTRPAHRAANKQERAMDEKFNVGGALMTRPGDPAGGANNVVRCRCVLGWITGGE